MKHLKAKLMATVMSLTLSMLMLTSASFAWFTISTAPEVRDMTTNVATNKNLEIALAKPEETSGDVTTIDLPDASGVNDIGQNMKWGNLVDLKGFFQPTSGTNAITLKPVKADFSNAIKPVFSSPKFGQDGRIKEIVALNRTNVGTAGSANFNDMGGLYKYTDGGSGNEAIWAYEVDYWLRSNVSGNISLTTAARRGDSDSEQGLGSYITNNKISVKFVVCPAAYNESGTYTGSVDTAHKIVFNGKLGTLSSGKYPLTLEEDKESGTKATSFAVVQNKEYLVKMYVYFDGGSMTNADFTGIGQTCELNVQFANDAIANGAADAMQVTQLNEGTAASANSTGG